MKKVLALLLIVAFVGVAVVAQDEAAAPTLKFSGRVQTGAQLSSGFTAGDTVAFKFVDTKDSGNALDSRYSVTYGDGKTYGLNAGFGFSNAAQPGQATSTVVTTPAVGVTTTLGSLYALDTNLWVKPIEQVKITVGRKGFSEYGMNVNGNDGNEPTNTGFQFGLTPFAGMDVLSAISIDYYLPISFNQSDAVNSLYVSAIGVKFADPKLFTLSVAYFISSDAATGAFVGNYVNPTDKGEVVAWFGLNAVENLTAQLGTVVINDLVTGSGTIYEKFGYNFGFMDVSVYGVETIGKNGAFDLEIKPKLGFSLVPNILNPWIYWDVYTYTKTGLGKWSLYVGNTFVIGNNGFEVKAGIDNDSGNKATWAVKASYNLSWN